MPYRDGTGPNGQGKKTGRGMGNCAPNSPDAPTTTTTTPQRSWGLGQRFSNAFGRLFRRRRAYRVNRR